MTYQEALDYLAGLNKFGMHFGLERIQAMLDWMRHPEKRYKTVHVTGTNGKGSVTAALAAVLTAAGIRTGMYTSPHLTDYTERIAVDGQPISRDAFAGAIQYAGQAAEAVKKACGEHPTEFEVLTAAAFYYFAAAGVEYAVIEVGLGGLLDSTNVIIPEAAVITNVTLEHTDRCGNTVEEIAAHKAGIIKEGVPVITAAQDAALSVIAGTAENKTAPLFVYRRDFCAEGRLEAGWRQRISVRTGGKPLGEYAVRLLGRHQVENIAVAAMTAHILAGRDSRIRPATVKCGLEKVVWPGRFEVVPGHPTVVIDGAHNPAGAQGLRATLDEVFPGPIVFLLGILQDKDVQGIIRALIRPGEKVITVRPESSRAAEPGDLARKIPACQVSVASSIAQGLAMARSAAGPDGVVCVAGSLYLIGAARPLILAVDN